MKILILVSLQVKPDFEQLTQEDVFILNNEEDIYLFSMKQKNSEEKTIKETVGKSLSHLIQEMKGSEMGILFSGTYIALITY